jgi:hypothetical protein
MPTQPASSILIDKIKMTYKPITGRAVAPRPVTARLRFLRHFFQD